jgi:hypothetical protein
MFQLLLSPILSAVTSVASGAGSLAVGAAKTAVKALSATDKALDDEKQEAEGKGTPESGGGGGSGPGTGGSKEQTSKMFGGLDLVNVKSAIDDRGPMGPEEEGPKTVYKIMIQQLQTISSTLLRMEESLRMLLSIEYEKIQGMMSMSREENLEAGDTDAGEKPRGLLGRAAGAVGGVLGGAYSKVKGGLGSNLMKMIGLSALIVAFKKYPDEIKAALEKVLKFFKSVFDYFTADDFTWKKFKTDWVDIFFPKMKGILMGALDWLWNAIKGVTKEFLLGASGDKAIRQGRKAREEGVAGLKELDKTLDFDKVGARGVTLIQGKFGISTPALKRLGLEEDSPEAQRLEANLDNTISAMRKLTKESDGRIQFKGLPDMTQTSLIDKMFTKGTLSINDILNAIPIIDGIESSFKDLNNFKLYESAGVTKETDEGIRESITDNLAKMSEITRMLNDPTTDRDHLGKENDGKINIGTWLKPKFVTDAEARAHIETLRADNLTLGAFSSEVFNEPVSTLVDTDGTSPAASSLNAVQQALSKRVLESKGGSPSQIQINTDNSSKIAQTKVENIRLQAKNIEFTQYQLARLNNGLAVSGF